MAGRRGALSGRGWDAIPPRAATDHPDEVGSAAGRRGGRRADTGDAAAPARSPYYLGGDIQPGEVHPNETRSSETRSSGTRSGGTRRGGARFGNAPVGTERDKPAAPPRSESEVAREICLRQLAARPRTRAELAKVLVRKEISAEVIAEVLDRYDEVGIIDDAAFARAWVSSRHQGRGLARRALANELRQRGVDAEVAGEALEAVDDESEAETARALVDRKLRTATGPPDAVFRRLVGMLARKGYPAGIAFRAVKDALAARDAEAAEFAEAFDADAAADEIDPQP